ncbi:MAG TPA: metallophosphoesterase [Opitutaceae bacterium]|jgi:metallophosphoesterase superfamily enzyme|nr:metallophosphoesterase [Opitutaceae bacterium]
MATSLPPRAEILPDVWLDARLALWLPQLRLLVAADLHWGYAASHRAQGNLLPLWGDGEIAARLDSLVKDYAPDAMLWLGDSLHTLAGSDRAEAYLACCRVPVTVVAGNHDRRWNQAAIPTEHRGRFFFHHGDAAHAAPPGTIEIIGHHHPAATWSDGAGARLKLPALVASEARLILPAFSPWAAGAPWNGRLRPGERLWAVSPQRILPLPAAAAVLSA